MVDRQVSHTVRFLGIINGSCYGFGGDQRANGCHRVTPCGDFTRQIHLVGFDKGYLRARLEEKRAGREGTGSVQGYNACAYGDYATCGNSGNVSRLAPGDDVAEVHLVLDVGGLWFTNSRETEEAFFEKIVAGTCGLEGCRSLYMGAGMPSHGVSGHAIRVKHC